MIKHRQFRGLIKGTLTELNADAHVWPLGYILIATDENQVRFADGVHAFTDLETIMAEEITVADKVTAFGATTNMTAVPGVFADLAAARSAVNQLRTDAETRLDAIETKVDLLLTKMIAAGQMSAT